MKTEPENPYQLPLTLVNRQTALERRKRELLVANNDLSSDEVTLNRDIRDFFRNKEAGQAPKSV